MTVMKTKDFKNGLIEAIKVGGQMMIDNAEDIAGKTDYISNLSVTIDFDPEFGSIPKMTIRRSHLPNPEQLDHIFASFDGGNRE